jgi:hypothetical protein
MIVEVIQARMPKAKKIMKEPGDAIIIDDMPGVHHVVYPTGWYIGDKLDPNQGGLAPRGEKVK